MTVLPLAIVIGAAGTAALLFYGCWERLNAFLGPFAERRRADLERAQINRSREELIALDLGAAAALWSAYMVLAKPPLPIGIVMLPAALVLTFAISGWWIQRRIARRLAAFNDQLETILRLIASGMRAGLSLRQAFVLIAEELADPARHEFRKVIAQTDVGLSANDALDALAARMPGDELAMMVRAIRVNSLIGGNLGKILDHLAGTIKERRRIRRKISALTAEGRASGWVIGILPLGVGAFIAATQPHMRAAMLETSAGHLGTVLFLTLETLGILVVSRIVRIDV